MIEQDAQDLVSTLVAAVNAAHAELACDGWAFEGASSRFLMKTYVPVLAFRRGDDTLCFIVTPSDPSGRSFKRSARFDLSYFSEDVADDDQGKIYARDREQIERVAKWLQRWDVSATP
jgi:hypothetical protein